MEFESPLAVADVEFESIERLSEVFGEGLDGEDEFFCSLAYEESLLLVGSLDERILKIAEEVRVSVDAIGGVGFVA